MWVVPIPPPTTATRILSAIGFSQIPQALGLGLSLQHKLGRQEAMLLRHRRLRALEDIAHQPGAVGQGHIATVDIACLLLIDQEKVIPAWPSPNIAVLAEFDIAIHAQDRQPAIAPGVQALRRKPVYP